MCNSGISIHMCEELVPPVDRNETMKRVEFVSKEGELLLIRGRLSTHYSRKNQIRNRKLLFLTHCVHPRSDLLERLYYQSNAALFLSPDL